MSVGRLSDDGTVSVFTKDGVSVYKEQDVLITCQGKPILIGVRDERGRYRVPLMQQKGQWQPRAPKKRVINKLQQANSVYDLPSIEQGIKWMHAVCGYPVKSTWLKAIKAGNFIGWPLLTEKNVSKYFPESDETTKGHLNQTRKNVRSTKAKPLEQANGAQNLKGKKIQDVFIHTYDVRETIFSDQTGQFPTRSQRGNNNKCIMVMDEIDSNAILVEPMKSRKDEEMIRAYDSLVKRLQRAGIQPKKHVLDNEISENMKNHIRDTYRFQLEMVPPGCHRRNAAEVAIRNFKSHFLSVLAGTADNFPPSLWDRLLPQTKITLNLLRQSNATPRTVSAYAHLSGPFDSWVVRFKYTKRQIKEAHGLTTVSMVGTLIPPQNTIESTTANCHIKSTSKQERLSDTVQFRHKHITNPELSPQDKIMQAIATCQAAIKGLSTQPPQEQMQEIKQLMQNINQHAAVPRVAQQPAPVPRVWRSNQFRGCHQPPNKSMYPPLR